MCDKSLGPAILEQQQEYIKIVLKEHLLEASNYTQLQQDKAHKRLNEMREET